jgi:hypothetical protein
MPIRFRGYFPVSLVLAVATILATSGATISASPNRSAPARSAVHRRAHTIRPEDTGCSGSGTLSFVGGGQNNSAEGLESGILSGDTNSACFGAGDVIGAGAQNVILNGGDYDAANYSFIGGGFGNYIGLDAESMSFIGAGNGNTINAVATGVVAGQTNLIDIFSGSSLIGAGANNYIGGSNNFLGTGTGNDETGDNGFVGAGLNNQAGPGGDDSSDVGDASEFVGAGSAILPTRSVSRVRARIVKRAPSAASWAAAACRRFSPAESSRTVCASFRS